MSMEWPTQTLTSWQHFVTIAARFIPNAYMYRGHGQASWPLSPSLVRILPEGTTAQLAMEVESAILDDFRTEAHLHVPEGLLPELGNRASPVDWWALMQHYGAPTRLLDWTTSLYVAAYFAVESHWDDDGAIVQAHAATAQASYVEHFGAAGKVQKETFVDANAKPAILFWYPNRKSARLVAQQGWLSVSTSVLSTHEDLIVSACEAATKINPEKIFYRKWIVPAAQKPVFLRQLRSMNIAAHSLFPGLDGICRSGAEKARLALSKDVVPAASSAKE